MNNINKLYKNIINLRKIINNDKKLINYYNYLKALNKNDQLYGWLFDDDVIMCDTLENLEDYSTEYKIEILNMYNSELKNIIDKGRL